MVGSRIDVGALSPAEIRIISMLALRDAEIATRLGVKEGTIRLYVSIILKKIGARNRTAAVLMALRDGLVKQYEFEIP